MFLSKHELEYVFHSIINQREKVWKNFSRRLKNRMEYGFGVLGISFLIYKSKPQVCSKFNVHDYLYNII